MFILLVNINLNLKMQAQYIERLLWNLPQRKRLIRNIHRVLIFSIQNNSQKVLQMPSSPRIQVFSYTNKSFLL